MPGSTGGGWKRSDLATVTGVAQPTGKPAEDRPQALPSGTATAPALDPTNLDYQAGATVYELATRFKIHRVTVSEHLHRQGVRWNRPRPS
jgi:hypothetical protein